jgi:hypothetical protein
MKPVLTPIEDLRPSAYNPRKADAERLELVELSLRKFGWLLPIYADADGEILSGHQRHFVAHRIGATMVPVVRVPVFKVDRRMGINVLYNRATNDMYKTRTTKELKDDLLARIEEIENIRRLPDIPVDSPEWYPILKQKPVATLRLAKINERWPEAHAVQMASYLKSNGLPQLPVICTPDYKVLNGLARLTFAIQENFDTVNAVMVPSEVAEEVRAMLNLLTMDYNIQERYEDLLRYNSFRRKNQRQNILSTVFVEDLTRHYINTGNRVRAFQLDNPQHVEMWKKYYGNHVIDFGAGLCDKTEILCDMGVDAVAFEPFFLGKDNENIDTAAARKITANFLERVADGTEWDTIFISHVFNSVPFYQDRLHIVAIVAALSSEHTQCHSVAVSSESDRWFNHTRGDLKKSHDTSSRGFTLDYEPRVVLSDIALKPKVQKYHTETEFAELMRHGFKSVDTFITAKSGCVQAVCRNARKVDPDELRAALEFEFDVPHPEGRRLGMAEEAKAAFSKRLGIKL